MRLAELHVHVVVLGIVALLLLSVSPSPSIAVKCIKKCGNLKIVYPFYVTNGSSNIDDRDPPCGRHGYGIECDKDAWIKLGSGRYQVLGLSVGVIRISLGSSCGKLGTFNLSNTPFILSKKNILQLYNCNRKQCTGNCSTPVLAEGLKESNCPNVLGGPCCKTLESEQFSNSSLEQLTKGYTSLEYYKNRYGCSEFTSWAYSYVNDVSFHMDLGLNLEWSISGKCNCSLNARCNNATNHSYTCQCKAPYLGDGYNQNGFECKLEAPSVTKKSRPSALKIGGLFCGVIAAATILGLAVVAAALLFRRKKDCFPLGRGMIRESYRKGDINMFGPLLSGMELFTYKQLDKATKGFASSEKLGNGACGAVYAANLDDGRRVAVKKLHYFNTQIGYQQTVNELSILCTVKHRNLVRLLGCCMQSAEPLLVFEYVSNGTLAEHLQRERGEGLDWFTRLTIAADTADALAYLHSMDPPILHRDVKSRNILIDHDFNTKVADFGLSRMGIFPSVDGSHISTIPQGTPGYLDPDYHQNFHLSDKSDVYSFGVVLIEIITALKPVDFSREKKEVNLAALAVAKIGSGSLDDIVDKFLEAHRRPCVKAMVQRVGELAFRCLAYDKDARPSMKEVLEELLLIKGTVTSPIVDMADKGGVSSSWTDAQSSQRHDTGSSLSSSETERFLGCKQAHIFHTALSLQVISEKTKCSDDVKQINPVESKHING